MYLGKILPISQAKPTMEALPAVSWAMRCRCRCRCDGKASENARKAHPSDGNRLSAHLPSVWALLLCEVGMTWQVAGGRWQMADGKMGLPTHCLFSRPHPHPRRLTTTLQAEAFQNGPWIALLHRFNFAKDLTTITDHSLLDT